MLFIIGTLSRFHPVMSPASNWNSTLYTATPGRSASFLKRIDSIQSKRAQRNLCDLIRTWSLTAKEKSQRRFQLCKTKVHHLARKGPSSMPECWIIGYKGPSHQTRAFPHLTAGLKHHFHRLPHHQELHSALRLLRTRFVFMFRRCYHLNCSDHRSHRRLQNQNAVFSTP